MECAGTDLAAELAAIDVSDMLPETGTIGRYTLTKDNRGGRLETWAVDATTVRCSIRDMRPSQPVGVGGRLADPAASYQIRVGRSIFLNLKDRITINNVVYDIQEQNERDTLSLFNLYWAQIMTDPNEATP